MTYETVLHRGTTLVRRMLLEPGEAMHWHRDPYHRVTVTVQGSTLAIELKDGSPGERFEVATGEVGWDEPSNRVHRGVNVGALPYEEVTVFFLDAPDAIPQPEVTE